MRRLKVDVDRGSVYVVLKLSVQDFMQISTATANRCYDGIKENKGRQVNEDYYFGLLHFVQGIERLISMQMRPEDYEDPIPLIQRSVKARRAAVEYQKNERQLLYKLIDETLAAQRAKRKTEPGTDGESLQTTYPERNL